MSNISSASNGQLIHPQEREKAGTLSHSSVPQAGLPLVSPRKRRQPHMDA
jgi:hypothetical protein